MPAELPTSVDYFAFPGVAVVGANACGMAVAADLALQGLGVRLFEWEDNRTNIDALLDEPVIEATGEIAGEACLDLATCDLAEAVDGAQLIVVCVAGLDHERLANDLAPLLWNGASVLLDPGWYGGALEMRRLLAAHGRDLYVLLGETATPTHHARLTGPKSVHVALRAQRVSFAALPGVATCDLARHLRRLFPGIHECRDVLEVCLSSGLPVVRTASLLNVPEVVAAADAERLAVGKALGYELLSEAATREPREDVSGEGERGLGMLHEAAGVGLVTYISLGAMLGVPTPTCESLLARASALSGRDYLAEGLRTVERFGIAGLSVEERETFLQAPRRV